MRARLAAAVIMAFGSVAAGPAAAQEPRAETAPMVAAGEWARDRLPDGALGLDPTRSDGGVGDAVAGAVARAIGARLLKLEDARLCRDVMDPSTCTLSVDALLAISPPVLHGDQGMVRVYAWYRGSSAGKPVEEATWDVRVRRSGGAWSAVGGEPH